MKLLAQFVGGPLHVQMEPDNQDVEPMEPIRYPDDSTASPLALISACQAVDGQGVPHDHYNLVQSWFPLAPSAARVGRSMALEHLRDRLQIPGAQEATSAFAKMREKVRSAWAQVDAKRKKLDTVDNCGILRTHELRYKEIKDGLGAAWTDRQIRLAVAVVFFS